MNSDTWTCSPVGEVIVMRRIGFMFVIARALRETPYLVSGSVKDAS